MTVDTTNRAIDEHPDREELLIPQADLYQLLSLFLRLPDTELAAGLADGTLTLDAAQILTEIGSDEQELSELLNTVQGTEPELLLSALRTEFTRLFGHPERPIIRIYESLFLYELRGRVGEQPVLFINQAALDAEALYRRAGLARSRAYNESADHFGIQLDFMTFLLRQRIKLLAEQGTDDLPENAGLIEEFKARHLSKWLRPLGEQLLAAAEHPVYLAVGRLCLVASE